MEQGSSDRIALVGLLTLTLAATVLSGCGGSTRTSEMFARPEFQVNASSREILPGQSVTFTTHTANTADKETQFEWSTTGGELSTEDNGQIAHVRFDRPGTYTVTSRLMLDHEWVESDAATVKVRSPQH
jgi:plastocyanin